jgi:CheY-like chemotaxis protein
MPVILNVDAHEAARTGRTILLKASGYRVVEAQSAAEAIRVMLRQTISLALVEMQLPDSDGAELCGTLKRLPFVLSPAVVSILRDGSSERGTSSADR